MEPASQAAHWAQLVERSDRVVWGWGVGSLRHPVGHWDQELAWVAVSRLHHSERCGRSYLALAVTHK